MIFKINPIFVSSCAAQNKATKKPFADINFLSKSEYSVICRVSKIVLQMCGHTHRGEKPSSCSCCDKKFSLGETKKNNERIHTCEKPYSCDFCNKKFRMRETKKKHQLVHTDEKLM